MPLLLMVVVVVIIFLVMMVVMAIFSTADPHQNFFAARVGEEPSLCSVAWQSQRFHACFTSGDPIQADFNHAYRKARNRKPAVRRAFRKPYRVRATM